MKEIKKISVHQTSKVLAVVLMLLSLVVYVPLTIWIFLFTDSKIRWEALTLLLVPLFSGLLSYVLNAIFCFFYNAAANLVGGIELEVGD